MQHCNIFQRLHLTSYNWNDEVDQGRRWIAVTTNNVKVSAIILYIIHHVIHVEGNLATQQRQQSTSKFK